MAEESIIEEIKEEKDTGLEDTIQEVVVLLMGGVIGGKAFEVASSNAGLLAESITYLFLLGFGVFTVYVIRLSPAIGTAVAKRIGSE